MGDDVHKMLVSFEDIRRCIEVLTDGVSEEEFLRLLELQENYRKGYVLTTQEVQRIQKELDVSLQSMADLETKLFHARRLLEMESKARREAEYERDQMEKKIVAVADLLQHERNLKDETKDKLAFLNTLPRKRKSLNPHVEEKYGNDINSTGSFLSDLSITQSEDDFLDVRSSRGWQKHRPSLPKNQVSCVGGKRSRTSGCGLNVPPINLQSTPPPPSLPTRRSATRRSGSHGVGIQQNLDEGMPSDRICATTKVIIPQGGVGPIRAESTIESTPMQVDENQCIENELPSTSRRSLFKQATAPPLSPTSNTKTPLASISSAQKSARPTLMRQHNYASKTFIRAEVCTQCQKKIRFGAVGLRCRDCPVRCHIDCRYLLTVSCVPQTTTPTIKGQMGSIGDFAPCVPPKIPAIIVHCVSEIETRGLNEVGIYRVSGSEREIKTLKERFLRGKVTPNINNTDIHVLCGCIKDFLRSLSEPLIPTNMWKNFCNAVQNPTEENIKEDLYKAIDMLPQANRDTLAFLILHFQRIAECPEILMPIDNIARVFGPTIVGYSSSDPDQHAIFTEVYAQCSVMLNLLKIPMSYWMPYVALDGNKENNGCIPTVAACTPIQKKDSLYSLYATPFKSTMKKKKFYGTPPIKK